MSDRGRTGYEQSPRCRHLRRRRRCTDSTAEESDGPSRPVVDPEGCHRRGKTLGRHLDNGVANCRRAGAAMAPASTLRSLSIPHNWNRVEAGDRLNTGHGSLLIGPGIGTVPKPAAGPSKGQVPQVTLDEQTAGYPTFNARATGTGAPPRSRPRRAPKAKRAVVNPPAPPHPRHTCGNGDRGLTKRR